MSPDDIQRIAGWLTATDIGLLELRGPGTTLRLQHDGHEVIIGDADASADETATTVAAPSVGIFLHRHPLRTDDFATPGTPVAEGQVLGLLQIGPLLLPVRAPTAGIVLDQLAAHGTAVGYGTPLVALTSG